MDARKLRRQAENLARKHAPKLERGVSGVERFALKRAKGREAQVHKAANSVRGVLRSSQRPR